ncbi:MAG TPA: enolase C-terminal domain-like protein, partial [bacterium]|nr:enolase C-terminal domain-like protein [bacterium]
MSNRVHLIHVSIPMIEPFRISSGEVKEKESILIVIERDGITAFGEASPMSGAFYSSETPQSTWDFLVERAIPALIEKKQFRPEFVSEMVETEMSEPFAWAGLEGALWDLMVQVENTTFMDTLGVYPHPIQSGLAVGIYPTIPELVDACKRYLIDGYKRLKIKIQPGWDIEPLKAVREAFGDIPLMVDANAAYTEDHFPVFDEIDKVGLMMIEQPLAKMNWEGLSKLQARISTPICIDESAHDEDAVKCCIDMQACRIVNIK